MGCIQRRLLRNLQRRVRQLEQLGGGGSLNLATINGQSLLNGGDIDVQASVIANEEFPTSWPKSGTMSQLVTAINNDTSVKKGKIYLSTVTFSDLPANLSQAEMKVEIMDINSYGVIKVFTVTSEDRSPYHWERTSAYNRLTNWRSWLPSDTTIPTVPSSESASSGGTTLSLVTTGEKYTWNNKANIWRGTQAEYDLLTPDDNTIYVIIPAGE